METPEGDPALEGNLHRAVELLEEATRKDPAFARAYALLVEAQLKLRLDEPPGAVPAPKAALAQARRLAPDAGETHFAEAQVLYWGDQDFDGALAQLEVAGRSLPKMQTSCACAG